MAAGDAVLAVVDEHLGGLRSAGDEQGANDVPHIELVVAEGDRDDETLACLLASVLRRAFVVAQLHVLAETGLLRILPCTAKFHLSLQRVPEIVDGGLEALLVVALPLLVACLAEPLQVLADGDPLAAAILDDGEDGDRVP